MKGLWKWGAGFWLCWLLVFSVGCVNSPGGRPLPPSTVFCSNNDDCGKTQSCLNNSCVWVEVSNEPAQEPTSDSREKLSSDDADGGTDNDAPDTSGKCKSGVSRPCFSGKKSECKPGKDGVYVCNGLCRAGVQFCNDKGEWSACTGEVRPVKEICDGKDNDCDGEVDEGCECVNDEYQLCGSDVGECKQGFKRCVDGKWSDCQGGVKPVVEDKNLCDGKDNDCDGQTDEECECKTGSTQACGSDTGECKKGQMQCTGEGKWGPCQSQTLPVSEKCDGKDNDCDGKVDETWEELGNVCTLGVGECKRPGKFVCSQDQTSTQCDAQPGKPVEEICDGKDNDCNGSIDENLNRDCFSNSAGQAMQGCTQENNGAWTCKGACQVGRQSCNSGSWQACKGFVQQSKETCDGKDNDCNGQVDEIQCECQNGQVRACGSSTGECKEGKQTCASGKWSSCVGKVDSTSEVCDGKDNDCDGITDENLSQDCQTGCGKGTRICTGGQFGDCSARKPTLETCGDKVDNDCDGKIDENCCFPSARFKAIGIELNTAEVVATSKTSNAWVASAHGNNIVLWDNTKKVIIRVLYGHTREVAGLVFAGKDQFLISSSADNTVRLFEVSTGKLLDTLSLGSIAYALVAQAPNYTRVTGVTYSLTSSRLRNIDLNTTTRKLSLSSNSIYGAFRSLAYSDDGKWFAATRGNAVHVYYGNTKKGELLDGRLGPSLYGVAIVSNKYVVAGYDNWLGSRGLKVWELASRKLLFSYKFPRGERANSMIAGAKGKRIVTVHRDRKMRLWELDIKGKKFRQKKEYSTSSSGFASPVRTYDSKHFFAPDQRVLLAWDLDKGGEKYRLNSAVRQVSYSSKGSLLVTTHASGMLRVFDAKNWTAKAAWKVADVSLETLALHPDETTAAVGVQKEVLVVNLTSQTTLRTLKGFRGFINRLVYHPVTQQLIVATSTGELSIFDNSGKLVKKLSGHGVSIYALAVSPDGKHLLSADRNKTILLWNTSTWSFKKLVGPATALLDAAFSPDSKQLAVLEAANQNNSLRIWDIANARWLTGLSPNYDTQASQDELHLVLYSSNNQWLLSTRSNIMTVYRNGATPSFYASQTPSYYDLRVTWSPIQSEVVITQENGRLDVFRCPTVAPTP